MTLPISEKENDTLEPVTFENVVERLEKVEETLGNLLELLGSIKEQIEPTLNALTNSPMFRMIFGAGKENGNG